MSPTTSVIIPLFFDRIELYPIINKCFESYKPQEGWELIAVDDGSPLACPDEWPIAFKHSENYGYTFAVNTGVSKSNGENIWIVNDDVVFNDEILSKMDDLEEDTIYLPRWGKDSMDDDKFGFFYGMTRNTWDKLGGLDETMPHYFSDLDMWKRAKQMGIKITKWDVVVNHFSGATYQGNQQRFLEGQKVYLKKWGVID